MQEFICDLRFRHLKVWREADFSCPRAVNKKAVTYHKWYGSSESGPRGSPFSIPSYFLQGFGQTCVFGKKPKRLGKGKLLPKTQSEKKSEKKKEKTTV